LAKHAVEQGAASSLLSITMNQRGTPLRSYRRIVRLIAASEA
jgi:hypothetical protein